MTVANRRAREQKMRRTMIIESAQHLFESKGFELTTVDEIAAGAELGKGTIYSYFKSKNAIYIAILEQRLEVLHERMLKVIHEQDSVINTLYRLYDTFIHYHQEWRGFMATLFLQTDEQSFIRLGDLTLGLKSRSSEWVKMIRQVLQRGIDNGEIALFDADKMAKAIIGMIYGIIIQDAMGKIGEDLNSYRSTVFQLVMNGICRC